MSLCFRRTIGIIVFIFPQDSDFVNSWKQDYIPKNIYGRTETVYVIYTWRFVIWASNLGIQTFVVFDQSKQKEKQQQNCKRPLNRVYINLDHDGVNKYNNWSQKQRSKLTIRLISSLFTNNLKMTYVSGTIYPTVNS